MSDKKRSCGPRKSKANPDAYTKEELIDIAVDKYGMKKSAASKMTKDDLCALINSKPSKSPKSKSSKKSPKSKSPKSKSPKSKSPKNKSSKKSPKSKSPKRKSPKSKSPKRKSPKSKSPKRKSPGKDSRPCGPRKTKTNNSYTKAEVVDLAIEKGMKKSVANKMKIADLCLEVFGSKKKHIIEYETDSDDEEDVQEEEFDLENCKDYSKEKLIKFASERDLSTSGTKKELCNSLIEHDLTKFYDKCKTMDIKDLKAAAKSKGISDKGSKNEICARMVDYMSEILEVKLDVPIVEKEDEEDDKEYPCINKSKLKLKDYQKRVVKHMISNRGLIAVFGTGMGKCHGKDTPIMMHDGSIKLVQNIQVGDLLMGDDSTPRKVLSLAQGREKMYSVEQNYGDNYIVNESHILCLSDRGEKMDIPLVEYLSSSRKDELTGYCVPVEFPEVKVDTDPYFVGVNTGNDCTVIPTEYLINSRPNRLALLAGIIDMDGYYDLENGSYILPRKSEILDSNIKYLCRTLGFRAETKGDSICVVGNINEIPVLTDSKRSYSEGVTSLCNEIKVVPLDIDDYYGFEIDGNHRYLLGDCTVTHNTLTAVTSIQCVLGEDPKTSIVIITPTSLVENMKKEFVAYGADPEDDRVSFTTMTKFANDFEAGKIKPKNTFLIVDEAQNLKSHDGKNSKAVISFAKKAKKVLLLTATPVMNRPSEIINLIAMVDGTDPISVTQFDRHIMPYDDKFEDFFRCKISYVVGGLNEGYPTSEEHTVEFPMTQEYYKSYREVEMGQESSLCSSLFGCGSNLQAFYNGIRRAANNIESEHGPKINWIVDRIKSMNKKNKRNKTLVYSSFLDAGSKLVMKRLDELNIDYVKVDGTLSKTKRQEAVKLYNSGKVKIIFISKAGGEGLDLKGTRDVIITEPAWNDENLKQVRGRAVRYLSHDGLPDNEKHVDIWNLIMIKPPMEERDIEDDEKHGMEAIDVVMKQQAMIKSSIISEFMDRIKPLTIEESDCNPNYEEYTEDAIPYYG